MKTFCYGQNRLCLQLFCVSKCVCVCFYHPRAFCCYTPLNAFPALLFFPLLLWPGQVITRKLHNGTRASKRITHGADRRVIATGLSHAACLPAEKAPESGDGGGGGGGGEIGGRLAAGAVHRRLHSRVRFFFASPKIGCCHSWRIWVISVEAGGRMSNFLS